MSINAVCRVRRAVGEVARRHLACAAIGKDSEGKQHDTVLGSPFQNRSALPGAGGAAKAEWSCPCAQYPATRIVRADQALLQQERLDPPPPALSAAFRTGAADSVSTPTGPRIVLGDEREIPPVGAVRGPGLIDPQPRRPLWRWPAVSRRSPSTRAEVDDPAQKAPGDPRRARAPARDLGHALGRRRRCPSGALRRAATIAGSIPRWCCRTAAGSGCRSGRADGPIGSAAHPPSSRRPSVKGIAARSARCRAAGPSADHEVELEIL